MRVIVRSLALIVAAGFFMAHADVHSELSDLFASMTSALSDDNAAGFMNGVDKSMPDYEKLQGYVRGLIDLGEITCNVEWTKDEGDESKRSVDLDWTMQVRSRALAASMVEHEQTVHVELVKQKKHWRIVSIGPVDFFTPAKFTPSK